MDVAVYSHLRAQQRENEKNHEGAVVLVNGTRHFNDDKVNKEPSTTLVYPRDQYGREEAKVLRSVLNSDSTVFNKEPEAIRNIPIIEEPVEQSEVTEPRKLEEVKLIDYGEDLSPSVSDVDDGLSENMEEGEDASAEETEETEEQTNNMAAMREDFEKAEAALEEQKQKHIDEITALKKDFEKKEAENLEEFNASRQADKIRLDKAYAAAAEEAKAHEEEKKKLQDGLEDLEAKCGKLESEKKAREREIKTKEKLLADLKEEKKRLDGELDELHQTVIPENTKLKSDNEGLRRTAKSWEVKYDNEVARNMELTAQNDNLESQKAKMVKDTREAKQKAMESERLKSDFQGQLDDAFGNLKTFETQFRDEEMEVKRLSKELRAEQIKHESARAELKSAQEDWQREGSQTERNIRNLEVKNEGMKSQIEAMTLTVEKLENEIGELTTILSTETRTRKGAQREKERLKEALRKAEDHLFAADEKVSSLESELNASVTALTSEKKIRAKQFEDLQKEQANHASTRGMLEDLQKKADAKIIKLQGDLRSTSDAIRELKKARLDAEDEADEIHQDLEKLQKHLNKKEILLEDEKKRALRLREELKEAVLREREYNPERLYELDRKVANLKAKLMQERSDRDADIMSLKDQIRNRDNKIVTYETKITTYETKTKSRRPKTEDASRRKRHTRLDGFFLGSIKR